MLLLDYISDNRFTQTLHIKPQFSLTFSILLLSLHFSTLSIVVVIGWFYADLSILTLGLLIILSAWRSYRYDTCFIGHPLYDSRLVILQQIDDDNGELALKQYLLLKDGQRTELLINNYAQLSVVILNVRAVYSRKRMRLIIWHDMLDQDTFRQLRVRLKYPYKP